MFVVERPGGGNSLNAGFPEVLMSSSTGPMLFTTEAEAVAFMSRHAFDSSAYTVRRAVLADMNLQLINPDNA